MLHAKCRFIVTYMYVHVHVHVCYAQSVDFDTNHGSPPLFTLLLLVCSFHGMGVLGFLSPPFCLFDTCISSYNKLPVNRASV